MSTESGFEEFVERCYDHLLRYAVVLTGDRFDAEELVQEALARCLRRWRRRPVEHDLAYARTAVFHEFLRSTRRWRRSTTTAVEELVAVEDFTTSVVERHRLLAALLELPSRQRAAVVARHVLDLSEEQAARELGCAVGTVKSLTSRGLARIRNSWRHGADSDAPAARLVVAPSSRRDDRDGYA